MTSHSQMQWISASRHAARIITMRITTTRRAAATASPSLLFSSRSGSVTRCFHLTTRLLARTNRYTDGSGRALEADSIPDELDLPLISNRAYPRQGYHWQPKTKVAVPLSSLLLDNTPPMEKGTNEKTLLEHESMQKAGELLPPASALSENLSERDVPPPTQEALHVVVEVPSPHKGTVIVSGGGVVGLTTAALFGLRGWHTTVVERSPSLLRSSTTAQQQQRATPPLTNPHSGELCQPRFSDAAALRASDFPAFIELQYALLTRRGADVLTAAGLPVSTLRACGVVVTGVMDHPGDFHTFLARGLCESRPFPTKVLSVDLWALRERLEEHIMGVKESPDLLVGPASAASGSPVAKSKDSSAAVPKRGGDAGGLPYDNVRLFFQHEVDVVYPLQSEVVIKPCEAATVKRTRIEVRDEKEKGSPNTPHEQTSVVVRRPSSLLISPMRWAKQYAAKAVRYDLLISAEGVNSTLRDLLDVEGFQADAHFGIKWFLLRTRKNRPPPRPHPKKDKESDSKWSPMGEEAVGCGDGEMQMRKEREVECGARDHLASAGQQKEASTRPSLHDWSRSASPPSFLPQKDDGHSHEEDDATRTTASSSLSPEHIHRWLHDVSSSSSSTTPMSSSHPVGISIAFPRLENQNNVRRGALHRNFHRSSAAAAALPSSTGRAPEEWPAKALGTSEAGCSEEFHYFSVMAYLPREVLETISDADYFRHYLTDVWEKEQQPEDVAHDVAVSPVGETSDEKSISALEKRQAAPPDTKTEAPISFAQRSSWKAVRLRSFTSTVAPAPTIFCENLYNSVGLPNAVLLGDAAHFQNPFWLQQLSLGLEDGAHLLHSVDAYDRHFYDALKQYSAERGHSGDALREITDRCLYYERKKYTYPWLRLRNAYHRLMHRLLPMQVNTFYEGSTSHVYSRSIEEMLNGRGYTSYEFVEKQQAKHRMFYHWSRLYT